MFLSQHRLDCMPVFSFQHSLRMEPKKLSNRALAASRQVRNPRMVRDSSSRGVGRTGLLTDWRLFQPLAAVSLRRVALTTFPLVLRGISSSTITRCGTL